MLKEVSMNKIRRVIWSGTRNCFVVVSELVKGHVKRSHRTTKSRGTVALLCATLLCSGVTSYVGAADETVGTGKGVAYGTGSVATDATGTAVGSGAQANAGTSSAFGNSSVAKGPGSIALGASSNASSEGTVALGRTSSADGKSSISIGDNARVVSNGYSLTSIAMGKNAYVLNGTGQQEYEFSFNKDSWNETPAGLFSYKYDPKEGTDALDRLAGGIAIGTNAYARTGSVEIGGHTMQGKIMGGTTVDGSSANIIDMTTIGTNSYNKGMMATIVGAYSINTGDFNGKGGLNSVFYGSQNMGSVLVGSLNQNRSKGKTGASGIANAIVGVANIAENANGALIYGAGNTITNSIASISGFDANSGVDTVDEMLQTLTDAIRSSKGGGATMAFGGGNVADYTNLTMITGVKNTVKGTADNIIKLDSIIGYNNAVTGASDIKLIGNSNTIEEKASNNIIFGDNYTLKSGKTNNVILGSAEEENRELAVSNATILGYNANVRADGGVALGFGSIASIAAGVAGYNPKGDSPDDATWKSTWAAVSVGDGTNTRQITGVAAGTNDTDAVNVAQLKKVAESAGGSGNLIAGDGIKLVKGSDGSWTISTNFTNSGSDNVSYKEVTDTTSTTSTTTTTDGNTTTDNTGISGTNVGTSGTDTAADTTTTQQGKAAVIETTLTADDGNSTTISESGKLGVKGDDSNIITSVSGSDVKVSLHKDISVNSVTVNDGPTINSTGIDMNGKKISNLADGDIYEGSHDAVTGGQLWNVEQGMNNQVRHLDKKINRVGAGAAALAALHPLDFDADDKWNIAAGVGAYKGTSAMALGAFYRPNEVTQLSIGGAFGNGENMWNMGISWRTGSGESYSGKSKAELVRMVNAMEARDAQQDAIIQQQQADIQKQQEGLAKQEAEINELKAMVQQLLAK